MSMTEVVEESLKADPRFRNLTVMPIEYEQECECCDGVGHVDETLGGVAVANPKAQCPDCDGWGCKTMRKFG